ncbi:MAG: metallophosphoesterase [Lentisphaeria bacterium]|nr:metallophosphoesterase [Lentisphaeria bacterium]
MDKQEETYRVLLLGDLHYNRPGGQGREPETDSQKRWKKLSLTMWADRSGALLEDAARRISAGNVPLVLQTGDLIQGDCDTPERQSAMFRDAIGTVKRYIGEDRRFLPVVGNHDLRLMDTVPRGPEYDGQGRCIRAFAGEYGPVRDTLLPFAAKEAGLENLPESSNYSFRRGRDLFLLVDPFRAGTLDFIGRTLDAVPDTRYVFVVSHLSLLPCDPDRALALWLMPDPAETAALLAPRNAVILTGHTHWFHLVRYRHPRGIIAQLAVSSIGTHWPHDAQLHPDTENYREYARKMAPLMERPERFFPAENYLEHRSWCSETDGRLSAAGGYAVLDIGPAGVSAEIFTGRSAPDLVLQLIGKTEK